MTVISGQVATVTFNNKLKRGDLQVVKTAEDGLNEGVKFHLYGTSLAGVAVDEYAASRTQTAWRPLKMSLSPVPHLISWRKWTLLFAMLFPKRSLRLSDWNEVTNRSFLNILKKFSVTVTKSDAETSAAQGDASLAGAVYGIYRAKPLWIPTPADKNGQFVTKEYICDNDWTVREFTPPRVICLIPPS